MRLATRAHIAALIIMLLCVAVSAQTLRSPQDPRNQAPTVGTGGPVGGPTGLFTIYDGDTIRKGEFTFSVAYSNFDRDPGNVDIVDIPLSFNVGLNDHVELFYKVNGYRGIKVNTPQNLSSFYLPNSQLYFGASTLCTGAAIILPPERVSGSTELTGFSPLFRPAGPPCNVGGQPFLQYPFIGGPGPNFGLTGNAIAPPFVSRIGTPTGGSGSFGTASNFPGLGSSVGSILPGIVLATTVLPATALTLPTTVPTTFTIAPSYLPDAPFVNRLYGETAWGDMVVGAKIRLTGPNSILGVAVIPFYRWYTDTADDFGGFNQLQRGASPGANIGDFGFIGVVDGRLSQHVNVAANIGYILNSNPKSSAMGDAVLLDRPDELLSGVGIDYSVNKHFQLIGEARSTMYVAGKTPNAFNNNPVEMVAGIRIFPKRWWGIGIAYRRHMNQQDSGHFNSTDFNTQINQVSGVFVPGRGIVIVPGTTRPATAGGAPVGFNFSDDPNGFIFQFWIGHRNSRIPPNVPPTVYITPPGKVTLPCPPGEISDSCPATASNSIQVTAVGTDTDGDPLVYTWNAKGGTPTPSGGTLNWVFSEPGNYEVTVTVDDGHNPPVTSPPVTVVVDKCENCHPPCPPMPTVSVSCPADVLEGAPITFTASSSDDVTYNWTVSAGTIGSGQGTSTITVETAGLAGQTVTATVEVTLKGDYSYCPPLKGSGSCSTAVKPELKCEKFDEYADLKFNDEKARLDNLAIKLQQDPGAQAYYVIFGSCDTEGAARSKRAVDYLVSTRGIDSSRITVVDGGCRESLTVELWVCPKGVAAPTASNSATVDPCPKCKPPRYRRTRRGRRD